MVYMSTETSSPVDKVFVFAGILVAILASYAALSYSDRIFRRIGRTGTLAISRILGLLLAAIAVQFVINGTIAAARLNGLIG
jgi:multiple antibiotic resistance protein